VFGSAVTAGTFAVPSAGYGYAVSGFDTITDFEAGVDQIRLEGRLFSTGTSFPTANAPGAFLSVASTTGTSVENIVGKSEFLIYDRQSGILYGRAVSAADPTKAGTFGSQYIYNPTPVSFAGTLAPVNANGDPGTGLIVNSFTASNFGTSAVGTVSYYILPQTPVSGVAFSSSGTVANSSVLPIPFAQVLNGGAPVTNLTYGRDIVIF